MKTIRITTPQNIDIDYEVAGLGERVVARLIDLGIFVFILYAGLIVMASMDLFQSKVSTIVIIAIYSSLLVFYDLVCETFMNGQSAGKRIMKIKVISLDGARPRFGQYLMRWLFRIVDFGLIEPGLIALIICVVSEKPQRLGDIVAGTILVRTSPRTKLNNVVFMPANDGYEPVFREASQLNDGDAELIHEVINNYIKTGNSVVVYNMALRIKEHLAVTPPAGMNDMQFLQTVIKDYNYLIAQVDV